VCLEGARAFAAHPSHKRLSSSHVYRILECSCELCGVSTHSSGPCSDITATLSGGNTHVHGPQGSDSVSLSTTQDEETPLIAAARDGYSEIVQELLQHGASNIQDEVSQRLCMFPHLCEVLRFLLYLLLVDTCTCNYIVHVNSGIFVELYCCALHTDTTRIIWQLWTEVSSPHVHTHMYIYMQ